MRRIELESFLLADYNRNIKSLSETSFLIVLASGFRVYETQLFTFFERAPHGRLISFVNRGAYLS